MNKKAGLFIVIVILLLLGYKTIAFMTEDLCSFEELKVSIGKTEEIAGVYEGKDYAIFMTLSSDGEDAVIKIYEKKRFGLYPNEPTGISYAGSDGTNFYEDDFIWISNRRDKGLEPNVSLQHGIAQEEMIYVDVYYGNGDVERLGYEDGILFKVIEPENDPHYILEKDNTNEKTTAQNYVKEAIAYDREGNMVDKYVNPFATISD